MGLFLCMYTISGSVHCFDGLRPFCRFHSKKSVLYDTSVDFFHSQWYGYGKSKHGLSQIKVSMCI